MPKVSCPECGTEFYKTREGAPCPRCGQGGSAPEQEKTKTPSTGALTGGSPPNESTKALRIFNGILLALNTLGSISAFTLGVAEENFAFFVISIALVFGGLFGFIAVRVFCEIAEDLRAIKG